VTLRRINLCPVESVFRALECDGDLRRIRAIPKIWCPIGALKKGERRADDRHRYSAVPCVNGMRFAGMRK
jgi:hypothetical protein